MNYRQMVTAVSRILMRSREPISFEELKEAVQQEGGGPVDYDLILAQALDEMNERGTVLYDVKDGGLPFNIHRVRK